MMTNQLRNPFKQKYCWTFVLFVLICVFSFTAKSQVPLRFQYQAVAHRNDGSLVVDKRVGVRIAIMQGSENGIEVYSQSGQESTNEQGLFTTIIGKDSPLSIDWHAGPYFLRVEVDPEGLGSYTNPKIQQIVSVPFAIHSHVADSLRGHDLKEKQRISIGHDTIFLTGGSYVVLPPDFDGDYNSLTHRPTGVSAFVNDAGYLTGEVQVLSISNDTVFLTGGSFAVLPAGFSGDYNDLTNKPTIPTNTSSLTNNSGYLTTETQVLSIVGNTIYLTGGSSVQIPHQSEVQSLFDVVAQNNSAFSQLKQVYNPTDSQDALNKYYFDSVLQNFSNNHIVSGTHNVFNIFTCDTFVWHNTSYSVPGVYTYPYINELGIPSVDTLKLTTAASNNVGYTVHAFGSYEWHGVNYLTSGDYNYPHLNEQGCPCVDTLHLTISPGVVNCVSYRHENDTATCIVCGGLNWYGSVIRNDGVYQHSLGHIGYQGCDSIVKVQVQILPSFRQDTLARFVSPITWRGNVYSQQGDYGDTMISSNGCDSVYLLHLMEGGVEGIGAAKGLFSVSNGVQVRFAHGNLQYQSSSNYWQFAKHQYDVIGMTCASSYYNTWSDLFGWATSGYHDSTDINNIYFKPWDNIHVSAPKTSPLYNINQYGYGPSSNRVDTNLVGSSIYYDWGMYNSIVNGGNGAGLWRLLSNDEWDYLLYNRNNASYLHGLGKITNVPTDNGTTEVLGFILLCDNWVRPSAINFDHNATDCNTNSYTLNEWAVLEASGAVFLPMINKDWDLSYGNYWTSTSGGAGSAYAITLSKNSWVKAPYNRSNSYSVRLVQEHHAGVVDCECTYLDTIIVSPSNFNWHGYGYSNSGDYIESIVNAAGCDSIISLSLMVSSTGPLNGLFSVSDSHQVQFSKGNLQYHPQADLFRFANRQFDYVGEENVNANANYSGWLDLFGWGTSGYHNRADVLNRAYMPYETNQSSDFYGPSYNMGDWNLVGSSAGYDWGVHNPISNAGNIAGMWRSLTKDEWDYILTQRSNADELQSRATVNGVHGLILLPDGWTPLTGIVFVPDANDYETNDYSSTRWAQLEASGAVFLPACGYRQGSQLVYPNYFGLYWTSTGCTQGISNEWIGRAWYMVFSQTPIGQVYHAQVSESDWDGTFTYAHKHFGYAVRLVKDF